MTAGNYRVKTTNRFGCERSSDLFDFELLINPVPPTDLNFKVYPNPVEEDELILHFNIGNLVYVNLDYEIYDPVGRRCGKGAAQVNTAITHKSRFNVSTLAPGTYFIRINVNDFTAVKKFVKM